PDRGRVADLVALVLAPAPEDAGVGAEVVVDSAVTVPELVLVQGFGTPQVFLPGGARGIVEVGQRIVLQGLQRHRIEPVERTLVGGERLPRTGARCTPSLCQ